MDNQWKGHNRRQREEREEYGEEEVKVMAERVERALMGTKNSLASGPDEIGYWLIKAMKDIALGKGLFEEIAIRLVEG